MTAQILSKRIELGIGLSEGIIADKNRVVAKAILATLLKGDTAFAARHVRKEDFAFSVGDYQDHDESGLAFTFRNVLHESEHQIVIKSVDLFSSFAALCVLQDSSGAHIKFAISKSRRVNTGESIETLNRQT